MSNNLMSQQLPVQSIHVGQVEHIPNKLDSSMEMGLVRTGINDPALLQTSMSNMQMEIMGPSSTVAMSKQIPLSSSQAWPLELMSNSQVSQKLSVPNLQMGHRQPQIYNWVLEQSLLPQRQLGELGVMSNNLGSQQSLLSSKRKATMDPTSNNSSHKVLSNKRMAQMEHRPWLQQMSASKKPPVKMQSISTSASPRSQAPPKRMAPFKNGSQQSSIHKNQAGLGIKSPNVQSESFESVRSKLRESLAGALALVSQQQDKTSCVGKNTQSEASNTPEQTKENSQPSVDEVYENAKDSLAQKSSDGQNASQKTATNGRAADTTQNLKNNGLDLESVPVLQDDDASFSDSFFVKDELLQGNGLAWMLEHDVEVVEEKETRTDERQPCKEDVSGDGGGLAIHTPDILASIIEAELFKLFGGVNKKYKEKGRSLLFNLKDRNNPELRERVMSGEIAPERLCSMTAEELASKELSEWRMAKAEELAQMVVLPDSDVDIRRLVKKTHKGEFQVEVEQQDSISVEVAVGASSVTQMRPKPKEKESSPPRKPDQTKGKVGEQCNLDGQDVPCTITIPSSEGSDLMQGLMVDDEFKDAEFLPPIVSLDEFMESLNSEPPFENLPVDAKIPIPVSDKKDSQVGSESKSPDATADKPDTIDISNTRSNVDRESDDNLRKTEARIFVDIPMGERVWKGLLQLSTAVTVSVIGVFKSGEKTSAKEWPGSIEIKGRVRLEAFEKFLQELPKSRSRAVMALHFVCKEGSAESERANFSEVADSYVLDERVGFAEPAPGVELYLCPPHSRTCEMLGNVLPKDQMDALNAIDNGLVGVIVWRKSQTLSPKSASQHHKHNSEKQHHSTSPRRHQEMESNANVNITQKHSLPRSGPPANYPRQQPDENNDDDDVPPGFGPPAGRDEDDLPEFNFSSGSAMPRPQYATQNSSRRSGAATFLLHAQTLSRPVDQMRELVHRYGKPQTSTAPSGNWHDRRGIPVQPWNDDDDDMPEWRPDNTTTHLYPLVQQQPALRAHTAQQQTPHQPMLLQPHVKVMQQNPAPSWQQSAWVAPPSASHRFPAYQSDEGQLYAAPSQQGAAARRDALRSGGF